MNYFGELGRGLRTTLTGLRLTWGHVRRAWRRRTPEGVASAGYFQQPEGLVTLQYPHEQLPIPDNGRYRLHNEIDDCIVCDKCAKICPVDCITIDPIKATGEIGRASDGSPIRLYAATFDIDMAKCCYCGLCTVVCPTECLTMEKTFDYSTYDLGDLTYAFANLTPAEADEKRKLYEQFVAEKAAAKAAPVAPSADAVAPDAAPAKRPPFRPTQKPANVAPVSAEEDVTNVAENPPAKKPPFRPMMKPKAPGRSADAVDAPIPENATLPTPVTDAAPPDAPVETPAPKKLPFRPTMKPRPTANPGADETLTP